MVGRHVNAAPGEAYVPERLKPGGHHLLSRQRRGAVSTTERRRKETRERKALQGIGRPESAAFSERLDFRAAWQGQVRLLIGPWYGLHLILPHPRPLPRGEGEWATASRAYLCRSLLNNHRLNANPTLAVPSP